MSFLERVKQLFGFTSAPPVRSTDSGGSETIPTTPLVPTQPVAPAGPPPAAQRREQLLRFVIEKLRTYQNEPETAPIGIRLCIVRSSPEEEELYRVALWTNQPGKFQKELSRQLADNYINLPKSWRFDYTFYSDHLPECTYQEGNLGLVVLDKSTPDGPPRLARVVALVGQTEQAEYALNPADKTTYCIGRGHTTQTASGRVRTNDIVFLNEDDARFDGQRGAGNGAVSRAHATIRYDTAQRRYSLLVDEGGLPTSGNKTKVLHADNSIERADIAGMGYPLDNGDQIELGGEATLLFELL
ncbi:FHA domain-containing protein [Spirosoma soli]|uniref:FHA domain-containing protein n=1 Tax=Spirosoma soli TaxID=1770529 RepID=A0ABW5M6Z6_9BACT